MRIMREKKLWTIDEVLAKNGGPLPVSKAGAYKMAADGGIVCVRIGRRVFIPNWWLEKILTSGQ